MQHLPRCEYCILPASLPSVKLDDKGICPFCADYIRRQESDRGLELKKEKEFEAVVRLARGKNRPYDCLVPLSGGKDSTYALYLCDRVYKMKCLCVTFDNGFLSERARLNISNAIRSTRADHIMVTPNRQKMLDLYRLFIEKTGTFCPPCLAGIGMAIEVAQSFDIPLTVSGTGWRVTYLAGLPEIYQEGNVDFFRNVLKGEPLEEEVRPFFKGAREWNLKRMAKIAGRLLGINQLSKTNYIRLYDYFVPDYQAIYSIIIEKMGWVAPEKEGAEHLDCELHDVAGYLHHLKFPELSGHTVHRSGLVRMGHLSRFDALNQDQEELAQYKPPGKLESFLGEIGLTNEEFTSATKDWRRIQRFRAPRKNPLRALYHKITKQ